MKLFWTLSLWGMIAASAWGEPIPVKVLPEGGLLRGGKPYFIKGAGGEGSLELLQARGGNSVRTWSHEGLGQKLDEAGRLGITVAAGIWLEPECSWFSYNRQDHCEKQARRVREIVRQHRSHPALLLWGLGNEMEGDGGNIALWQQVNRLARLVHEEDPAHPVFTAVAGLTELKTRMMNEHAPDLDLVGINTYGALPGLREQLPKMGWRRPWVVTEYGTRGFWEVARNAWGAPLEPTSSEKAAFLELAVGKALAAGATGGCAGGYAFLWGQKQEASATWFGLLTKDGAATPAVEVLERSWTGRVAGNRAPVVEALRCAVANQTLAPAHPFEAELAAADPEQDTLTYEWQVLPLYGGRDQEGRELTPPAVPQSVKGIQGNKADLIAPTRPGDYRVYAYVRDGKGGVGTANVLIRVAKP